MNRQLFYLEIGNIDDDLIQEACEARGHRIRKKSIAHLAGVAACLCLLCTALLFGMHKDVIYYNEAPTPLTSKMLVPSDENTTAFTLTYQELFDYYGLEPFPDVLSGLQRLEQTNYFVYQLSEGTIYDTNIINYRSDDGKQTLSIVLSKDGADDTMQGETFKESRLNGVPLVLAVSSEPAYGQASPTYWAKTNDHGVVLSIVASGMDESSFTEIMREFIQLGK